MERAKRRVASLSAHLTAAASVTFTPEQLRSYDELGYVVVKKLFDTDTLERFRARFAAIASEKVAPPVTMSLIKDVILAKRPGNDKVTMSQESLTKIQDFQDDEILFEYCKDRRILGYVEALLGPDIRSCHTMLINKPPDLGKGTSRHPLHQDLYYFPFRGPIIASWTAMERVHPGNGCLIVVPGSHKGPLMAHGYPDWEESNVAYHGICDIDSSNLPKYEYLEMEAGDTVFFHPLLWHGSGRNKTEGYRKAISCHYASSHTTFVSTEDTPQDVIAKEVESFAAKKLKKMGIDVALNFADIWRMRSRVIQGASGDAW